MPRPCSVLSHPRRSFSVFGPSFCVSLTHSSRVRPVFCFKAASELWYMPRLGWTSYVAEAGGFLVAGIVFSSAEVYYRSSDHVIEAHDRIFFKDLHRITNKFTISVSPNAIL